MVEFSDFPVEIHQMIVERCDFLSRFNLRSTSKSMLEIVDSTKFFIPTLEIDANDGSIHLKALLWDRKNYTIKRAIEDPNSMEIIAKWMGNILKKAEIEMLVFSNQWDQFLQKFIENLKSPLKVRLIDWSGKTFSNFFDKKILKELNFFKASISDKSDYTGEYSEFLKDVERVSIYFPIDFTDEYVLSMNSTAISLDSDNFTAEMINRLVEKFISRGTSGSNFNIFNKTEDFRGNITIPDGFVENPYNPNEYRMTVNGKKMHLYIGDSVCFRIL